MTHVLHLNNFQLIKSATNFKHVLKLAINKMCSQIFFNVFDSLISIYSLCVKTVYSIPMDIIKFSGTQIF